MSLGQRTTLKTIKKFSKPLTKITFFKLRMKELWLKYEPKLHFYQLTMTANLNNLFVHKSKTTHKKCLSKLKNEKNNTFC